MFDTILNLMQMIIDCLQSGLIYYLLQKMNLDVQKNND